MFVTQAGSQELSKQVFDHPYCVNYNIRLFDQRNIKDIFYLFLKNRILNDLIPALRSFKYNYARDSTNLL